MLRRYRSIAGTPVFDGELAQRGYALNRMCFSLNRAENRAALARDEEGYCQRFGLTAAQREAIRRRDVRALLAAGGNIYYLAKLAGVFGVAQVIDARPSGKGGDDFCAKLRAAGAH